jgi:transcriptional regulator with XRE-family HTH domain
LKKPEPFAARLKRLRESAGLSITDLADASGISRQAVHKLERGERQPSLATAVTLARALGKSVAAFE